jgi:amino acid adenylation domain-containing protein
MSDNPNNTFSFFDVQRSVEEESYWRKTLSGDLSETNLPVDFYQSKTGQTEKEEIKFFIPETITSKIIKISKNSDLSLYVLLHTALKCLIYRYTNQNDMIIGSPLYQGIDEKNTRNQIVLIRTSLPDELTFKTILLQVRNHILKAYENQNYPFSDILKIPDLKVAKKRLPQIICLLENIHDQNAIVDIDHDISFLFNKNDSVISYKIQYKPSSFRKESVKRFSNNFNKLIESAIQYPDVKISELNLCTAEELQRLSEFNETDIAYPDQSIVSIFEEQVQKTPDTLAVVFEDISLSYEELNHQANIIADYLLKNYTIEPDDRIGLLLNRSEKMIVGMLGVLKTGAAFIPIDSGFPKERISHIISNSGCKATLQQSDLEALLKNDSSIKEIDYDNIKNHSNAISPNDLAYVIYTSGSTGMPKGVAIEHHSVSNLVFSLTDTLYSHFKTPVKELLQVSFVFDMSLKQVFGCLLHGSTLYILSDTVRRDPVLMIDYVREHNINIIDIIPVFWKMLMEHEFEKKLPPSMQRILVGGEIIPSHIIESFYQHENCKHITIANTYGPTEACVENTIFYADHNYKPNLATIPIGKPMPNAKVFILDDALNPVPIGISGNIYLAGTPLARGYINNDELTNKKFIVHNGERLYFTGDIGRWLSDGNIDFLGRVDDQVKIRGYRVELGEIENRLLKYPQISESVVVAKKIGDTLEVIAYLKASNELNINDIRSYLNKFFPDYMIPAFFLQIESLPITASGKIDKKALPDPDVKRYGIDTEYIPPGNKIEKQLKAIWEAILEYQHIGIHDNFFELGGHSIKATQLASRIHKIMKKDISIREIFNSPTIAGMSQMLQQQDLSTMTSHIERIPENNHYALSHAQKRLWLMDQLVNNSLMYMIYDIVKIEGSLNISAFSKAFETLIHRHESLRTVFITIDNQPRQKVCEDIGFKIKQFDFSHKDDKEVLAESIIKKELSLPFDLSKGPLIRISLIKIKDNEYSLLFMMHHIISDGWSLDILVNELFKLYNAYKNNQNDDLPPLKIQYKDYSEWHNQLLTGSTGDKLKEYWHTKMRPEPPILNLPIDFPRPPVKTYDSDLVFFTLNSDLYLELKQFCKDKNISLYMILSALVRTLLYRYTAQEDFIIGTALACRDHADLEDQIGFYVNLLPLRNPINGDDTFDDVLKQEKQTILEVFEHQTYPFDRLVTELNLAKDKSRFPIFDVVIDFQDDEQIDDRLVDDLKMTVSDRQAFVSEYDLAFLFVEKKNTIELRLTYGTSLFKRETMMNMLDHFENIMTTVLKVPETQLSTITLIETPEIYKTIEINTKFNF